MTIKAKLQSQNRHSFSFSGRTDHPISSTPLPRTTKPLMSQKVQKTAQSPIPTLLAQQQTPMFFRQSGSTQGKLSGSSGAIPNQWSSIEDLLSNRPNDSSQTGHVSISNKDSLDMQISATGLDNSNHRKLNASSASAQQLNSTELSLFCHSDESIINGKC